MAEQDKIYQELLDAQSGSEANLAEARKQMMLQQLAANLAGAGSQIGAGFATIGGRKLVQPDTSMLQNLGRQATEQFGAEQTLQKSKLDQLRERFDTYQKMKQDERNRALFGNQMAASKMALEKGGLELEQLRQLQRSDTPEAMLGQALVQEKYKDALQKANITPEQLKGLSPARLEAMKNILKVDSASGLSPYQAFSMQQRQIEEQRREDERQEKRVEKGLDKISTKANNSQIIPMAQSIREIDDVLKKLGGSIDSPPKGDIPGLGRWDSLKPDMLSSPEDMAIRQNLASLAGTLLKSRSGGAVTDPEYKRFLEEAKTGKFSGEKDTLRFIKKMRDQIYLEAKNIEAGVPEEALKEYANTFGAKPTEMVPGTPKELKPSSKGEDMIRIQLPDGRTGSVPKSKLEEAKKRGAKEI